jgi:hypothetical protein
MLKKLFWIYLIGVSACSFAYGKHSQQASASVTAAVNPAAIGSKQGSAQIFGEPKINKGIKGIDYYKDRNDATTQKNSSTNGGSKAGSAQVFGEPQLSRKKGKEYYSPSQRNDNPLNNAATGSRAGSNQVFGNPGKTNSSSPKK